MFRSSREVPIFEYLRIPYRVDGGVVAPAGFCAIEADPGAGARTPGRLLWPAADGHLLADAAATHREVSGVPVVARMLAPAAMVAALGDGWDAPAGHSDGDPWRRGPSEVALGFDPSEAIGMLWSESYREVLHGTSRRRRAAMVRVYYVLRPLIPRRIQIALRRVLARAQGSSSFPRWPIETAGLDLLALIHRLASEAAGRDAPWIAPWPDEKTWAFVLTHDVETSFGLERMAEMRSLEAAMGYRSSWNFVPKRYTVPASTIAELVDAGCEVGVHGLYHDGKDLASAALLERRLPEMVAHADRWGARGFRSPATQRGWHLMSMLPFDYDSSYPDTDPYEPQPGGCCTWLPYAIEGVTELPLTLPQDHTLFVILGHATAETWIHKSEAIRDRGGMSLLLTHPDYLHDESTREPYRELLATFKDDEGAWRALPRDVSAWWRARSRMSVVRSGDGWRVAGESAERASVRVTPP